MSLNELLLLICVFLTIQCNADIPVVVMPLGNVAGYYKESVGGRQFLSFEGVPYAKPPIGPRRFEPPEKLESWRGLLVANKTYKCLQYRHLIQSVQENPIIGEEDCLYLNIYTPDLISGQLYDVIVFIHGGAFMFNYGAFQGPEYLLDRDLVYVTLNYRLGPFGFLSTEDDVVPGNMGLKDQIAALEWIKEHIYYFAGNPNSVTISGNSAGAASVHFHYMIPNSKGLFHRGISQSGCALNPWVLMEKPLEKTRKLADLLECNLGNTKHIIECLKRKNGKDILGIIKENQPWLFNPFSPFGVVVDHWSSNPLIPNHPFILLKESQMQNLPWIVSHTNAEGLYPGAEFYDDHLLETIDKRWNEIIPHILDYNNTISSVLNDDVSQKIRQFYFNDANVSKSTFKTLIQVISDRLYITGIEQAAILQSLHSPTYYYYFTYRGCHSRSELRSRSQNNFGAAHGDDMSYILKNNLDMTSTEDDKQMSQLLINIWTSFANSGIPKVPIKWSAIPKGSSSVTYLKIESPRKLSVLSQETLGNQQFWKSLGFQENEHFSRTKDEL